MSDKRYPYVKLLGVKMFDENGRQICGAHRKGAGQCCHASEEPPHGCCPNCKCGGMPMENFRCKMHGGKSLRGSALPQFVDGEHSKYSPPQRLLEGYREARSDKEILKLTEEIAMCDARLKELVRNLDVNEAPALWRDLRAEVDQARAALAQQPPDQETASRHVGEIFRLVYRGASDADRWDEYKSMADLRRKLAESERRRLVEMHQMLTAESMLIIIGGVVQAIRKHVNDARLLAAISTEIGSVLSRSSGDTAGPPS